VPELAPAGVGEHLVVALVGELADAVVAGHDPSLSEVARCCQPFAGLLE
jgi:hypothetical protein